MGKPLPTNLHAQGDGQPCISVSKLNKKNTLYTVSMSKLNGKATLHISKQANRKETLFICEQA